MKHLFFASLFLWMTPSFAQGQFQYDANSNKCVRITAQGVEEGRNRNVLGECGQIHGQNHQGVDLSGKNLRGLWISNSDFQGAKFNQADLTGASIINGNTDKADFRNAIFVKTSIQSSLNHANLSGLMISNSTILPSSAVGLDLSGTLFNLTLTNTPEQKTSWAGAKISWDTLFSINFHESSIIEGVLHSSGVKDLGMILQSKEAPVEWNSRLQFAGPTSDINRQSVISALLRLNEVRINTEHPYLKTPAGKYFERLFVSENRLKVTDYILNRINKMSFEEKPPGVFKGKIGPMAANPSGHHWGSQLIPWFNQIASFADGIAPLPSPELPAFEQLAVLGLRFQTFRLVSLERAMVLLHEARHADCFGDKHAQEDFQQKILVLRSSAREFLGTAHQKKMSSDAMKGHWHNLLLNEMNYLSSFISTLGRSHLACSPSHAMCTKGRFKGSNVCDDRAWGPYTLQYLFAQGLSQVCANCTQYEKEAMRLHAADSDHIELPLEQLFKGEFGEPSLLRVIDVVMGSFNDHRQKD